VVFYFIFISIKLELEKEFQLKFYVIWNLVSVTGVLRYLARLRRYSPWWIAGSVEQRFTGYEFDEARIRGVDYSALSPLLRER